MNDYLAKPISPQALAEALDKWLQKEPAATTDATPATSETAASACPPKPEAPAFNKAAMMTLLMDDEELAFQASSAMPTPSRAHRPTLAARLCVRWLSGSRKRPRPET